MVEIFVKRETSRVWSENVFWTFQEPSSVYSWSMGSVTAGKRLDVDVVVVDDEFNFVVETQSEVFFSVFALEM